MLFKAIYYLPSADKLVFLSKVQNYEDDNQKFVICDWEDDSGTHNKVLIESHLFDRFIKIGDL